MGIPDKENQRVQHSVYIMYVYYVRVHTNINIVQGKLTVPLLLLTKLKVNGILYA